jgi:hypothetical protein
MNNIPVWLTERVDMVNRLPAFGNFTSTTRSLATLELYTTLYEEPHTRSARG